MGFWIPWAKNSRIPLRTDKTENWRNLVLKHFFIYFQIYIEKQPLTLLQRSLPSIDAKTLAPKRSLNSLVMDNANKNSTFEFSTEQWCCLIQVTPLQHFSGSSLNTPSDVCTISQDCHLQTGKGPSPTESSPITVIWECYWPKSLGWKNSWHFATSPVVCPRNDVREMSAEIPHWWRVASQMWVVLLIGWKFDSPNQKHYPDLGSDASLVWNFRDRFSDINSQGNQRLIPSWKEKIERRLGLHKDAFLPMSLRAPQPKPNLLSPQKHIKATGYESGETNHRWRRKMSAV